MISVLMPVYNNLRYLKSSVDSILNQTYQDFEFIIVDDCSTEPVWDFLQTYKDDRMVLRKNKENIGLTKSLNLSLSIAKGDIIARQDGDDISLPNRFENEVNAFIDNVGLVSCWGYSIDKKNERMPDNDLDKKLRVVSDDFIKKDVVKNGNFYILGPASMYSKKAVNKIGYYDERLYFSQDRNYWIRILKFFDVKIIHKELYVYRRHDNSVRSIRKDMNNGVIGQNRKQMVLRFANDNPIIKGRTLYSWETP